MPDLVAAQQDRRLDDRGELDGALDILRRATERPQIANDRGDARGAVLGIAKRLAEVRRRRQRVECLGDLFEVRGDERERVVDLVRDARGQRTDRGHALAGA